MVWFLFVGPHTAKTFPLPLMFHSVKHEEQTIRTQKIRKTAEQPKQASPCATNNAEITAANSSVRKVATKSRFMTS